MEGHVRPRHSARRGKREAVRLVHVVWWSTKELPGQAKGFSFALRTRGYTESSKRRADRSDSGLARPCQAYRYNTYKQYEQVGNKVSELQGNRVCRPIVQRKPSSALPGNTSEALPQEARATPGS